MGTIKVELKIKIKEYVMNHYDEILGAINEIINTLLEQCGKEMEEGYREIIDKYYEYPQKMYKRSNSLYNAYEIEYGNGILDSKINLVDKVGDGSHRVDEVDPKYIYEHMYVEGWHGGANGKGKGMGIPIPRDGKAEPYNGKVKPWADNRKFAYRQAGKTESPALQIQQLQNELIKNTEQAIIDGLSILLETITKNIEQSIKRNLEG